MCIFYHTFIATNQKYNFEIIISFSLCFITFEKPKYIAMQCPLSCKFYGLNGSNMSDSELSKNT